MGYRSARDMIGQTDLETAIRWHLTSNHFPSLPEVLVPVALQAIELAQSEEWDTLLPLPAGVEWRGRSEAPVSACVRAWHLVAFLE